MGHSRPGLGSSGSDHVPYVPKADGSRLSGDYDLWNDYDGKLELKIAEMEANGVIKDGDTINVYGSLT
jgi:hypothetical protein